MLKMSLIVAAFAFQPVLAFAGEKGKKANPKQEQAELNLQNERSRAQVAVPESAPVLDEEKALAELQATMEMQEVSQDP